MCPVLDWCGLTRETQTDQASQPLSRNFLGNHSGIQKVLICPVPWEARWHWSMSAVVGHLELDSLGICHFLVVPFTVRSPHLIILGFLALPEPLLRYHFFVPHLGHQLF